MHTQKFAGHDGIVLTADVGGNPDNPPAILMHGGGQTRYSWGDTARALADNGYYVVSLDLRGHGESGWSPEGVYSIDRYVADLRVVCHALGRPAALIGASLGGVTALTAVGETDEAIASALVLVDITPRINPEGSANIGRFMQSAPNGFTTIDEAADAVAAYLPHRPRPKDTTGLMKNLRHGPNGRLHWHWDPRFLSSARASSVDDYSRMANAARRIRIPTLLVRGTHSELVTEESVRDFLDLVPSSEYAEIAGAHHMVAGDRNTVFSTAVTEFMQRRVHHGAAGHFD